MDHDKRLANNGSYRSCVLAMDHDKRLAVNERLIDIDFMNIIYMYSH